MPIDQIRYQALQLAQQAAFQIASKGEAMEDAAATVGRAQTYFEFLIQGLPVPPVES
jgi:hypothetical protein